MRATAAERINVFGLINVSEAARQLGVGIQRLHRDIRAGRVRSPQVRVGNRSYFKSDDLNDLSTYYKDPTVIGPADEDAQPEVIVYRDDNGEFRVRGNDGC